MSTELSVSNDNLTFSYSVVYLNRAPTTDQSSLVFSRIFEDDNDSSGEVVYQLAMSVGVDADDVVLGLAVTSADQTNGMWQHRSSDSTEWVPFPETISAGFALELNGTSWVRFVPNEHFFGSTQFVALLWDMSSVSSGLANVAAADRYSGPYSSQNITFSLEVLHINDPPVLTLDAARLTYTEAGGPIQLFSNITVEDVDGMTLEQATVLIDCLNSSSLEPVACTTTGDMIFSLEAQPLFQIQETSSSNDGQKEFSILPLGMEGSIVSFAGFLRNIYFDNEDLEPLAQPRLVQVFVSDGINSSNTEGVTIYLELVNDEVPMISLPFPSFTYQENSGPHSVFVGSASPVISDPDMNYQLESVTIELVSPSPEDETLSVECRNGVRCNYSNNTLTVLGRADASDYNQVLSTLMYENSLEELEPASNRYLTFIVNDGTFLSTPERLTIVPELINDQLPEISPADSIVNFTETTEQSPPSIAIASGLRVMDRDSGEFPIHGIQASLMDPQDVGNENIDISMAFPSYVTVYRNSTTVSISVTEGSVDSNSDTITGLSPFIVQDFFTSLSYSNNAMQPTGSGRVVRVTASDNFTLSGIQLSPPAVVNIHYVFVDDLPFAQLNSMPLSYSEGDPEVTVAADAQVNDVDNEDIGGLEIRLTSSTNVSQDVIRINESLLGQTITLRNYTVQDYEQTILLTNRASTTAYTSILRSLTFEHLVKVGNPPAFERTIQVTPLTLSGTEGVPDMVIIQFQPTNNHPVIDLNGPQPMTGTVAHFMEEGAPVYILSQNISLIDIDSPDLDFALVRIENPLTGDRLILDDDADIQSNIDLITGEDQSFLLLQGLPSPISDFRSLLLTVQFANFEDEPSTLQEQRNVTVIIEVGDGMLNDSAIARVIIVPVNDPPQLFLDFNSTAPRYTYTEGGDSTHIATYPRITDPDSLLFSYRVRPMYTREGDVLYVPDSQGNSLPFNSAMNYYYSPDFLTTEQVQARLQLVTISSNVSEPLPGNRVVCFSVLDDLMAPSTEVCSHVTFAFINDSPPVFEQSTYTSDIEENRVNQFVAEVRAMDADSLNSQVILVYSIVGGDDCMSTQEAAGSGSGNGMLPAIPLMKPCRFTINSTSGVITTTGTPPDYEERSSYNLTVSVSDGVAESIATVNVNILNVNDLAPQFDRLNYLETIPLGAQPGFLVAEIVATDNDLANPMVFAMSIEPMRQDIFSIFPNGSVYLSIPENMLPTDIARYTLIFNATDGEFFVFTSATLEVNVILNNVAPQFVQSSNVANVSEMASIGNIIIQTVAVDTDTGTNAEITYSISQESQVADFTISSTSGAISIARRLDFEATQAYSLTVVATDGGRPRRSSTATISIQVVNENEVPPVFEETQLVERLCEDAPVGSEIARVLANDSDAGRLGEITYTLLDRGNAMNRFALDSTTGSLTVAQPLDYEGYNRTFTVFIVAQDGGGMQSMEAQVEVILLNNNEFPPVFSQSFYQTIIPENYPVSSPLPLLDDSLSASDGDACNVDQCNDGRVVSQEPCTSSGAVTYSIVSGNSEGLFTINSETGRVSLTISLDFDISAHRSFNLGLVASDGEFNASASFSVTVMDFNEHLPVFENSSYSFTIPENVLVGISLATIRATDLDPTSVIQYTLVGLGAEDFDIGMTSGLLTSARPLDFARQKVYNLDVMAMNPPDNTNGSLPVSASLTINLEDVNNNPPIFLEDSYRFSLPENVPPISVGRVEATDDDEGMNAIISYSVQSVAPGNSSLFRVNSSLFRVNSSTGEIFSTILFDREQERSYVLTIQARDSGIPSLSSTVEATIAIMDENDNPPQLLQTTFNETVPENATVGTPIATIRASDPDDSNTIFTFRIVGGNSEAKFSINETGTLFIRESLDREQTSSYNLIVAVSDSGNPPRSSVATVGVNVDDVNDSPPVFSSATYSTSVSETVPPLYSFTRLEAIDFDQGSNAAILFSISNASVPFQIDPVTGVVSVSRAGEIDREQVSQYVLAIVAANPDGLSSTAQLVIEILDENDNGPMFSSSSMTDTVLEDFTPVDSISTLLPEIGTGSSGGGIETRRMVTTVVATDADQPNTPNSQITYSLISVSPQGNFEIDPSTGEVYVDQILDRESVPRYELVVEASDSNEAFTLTSRANISVIVGDINDNVPFFTSELFHGTVLENAISQTEVLRLQAQDYDLEANAEFVFSLETEDSLPFAVDPETGMVLAVGSLDRETTSNYSFAVTVANPGMTNSSRALVYILVQDVNDNPPQLDPSSLILQVDENQRIGTVLANFTFTDADIGINANTVLSITGNSSLFRLNNDNQLVVSNILDYEIPEHRVISFQVRARNTEPPREVAVTNVQIELNNLNDNPPIVNFGNSNVEYFERNKRLVLRIDAFIVDNDGTNITTLVDGIVEMTLSDPREPSEAFTPNTNDLFMPYNCPLEDDKIRKFEPCNLTLRDDHVFTTPSRDLMTRNFELQNIKDNTIAFDATKRQYAYSSIASNFLQTGLTISTWIWFEPNTESTIPFAIVSKASPTSLLYSVYCSPDGQDLWFQYQNSEAAGPIVFQGACAQLQGAWNHLAVVLDNSNPLQWRVTVFINAELRSTQSMSAPADEAGSVFVGTRPDGGVNALRKDYFSGRLHLLLFSYAVANANELNCAIGCGVAIISTLENTPLDYDYNYSTQALNIRGRYGVPVYEEFLNSLVLILPLIEPVSPTYSLNYTVQDDMFNCLPTSIVVILQPVNDHQPQFSLTGNLASNNSTFTAVFVEEGKPVPIVNRTGLFLTDEDLVAFEYVVTVRILNPEPQGSREILSVSNIPVDSNITVTYINYTLEIRGFQQIPVFQEALRTITYDNMDDEPLGNSRLIEFTVTDIPEDDVQDFSLVEIVLVNDAPEVNLTFSLNEYTEGDGPVQFIENAMVTDSDNETLVSALVRFNARDAGETLTVNTTGTNLLYSYSFLDGELSITGVDTLSNYASVLESLTYEHSNSDNPTPGTRVFYISVSDGMLMSGNSTAIAMVFFSAENDQPMVDLNGPGLLGINSEVTFREDRDTSVLVCPQAVLLDVDNSSLLSLSISLSPQPDGPLEQFTIDLPSELESNRSQILSGTGFLLPLEQYQTILRSLRYVNLADEPSPEIRTIQVVASDGLATSISASAVVLVQQVNDVPVVDIDTTASQPGYLTSYMENGPAVNITGSGVRVTDNDADAQISMVLITIRDAMDGSDERINSTNSNITFSSGLQNMNDSIVTYTLTFTEGISLQATEDLLMSLQYQNLRLEPTPGTRQISISVSDGQNFSIPQITTLELLTVNEHSPAFPQQQYSTSVTENMPPEVSVANVRAVDGDSGAEGRVSYQIEASTPPEGLGQFSIDSNGTLYTTAVLDRETVDLYVLTIVASDGGSPSRSSSARVEVTVLDLNDQSPMFTLGMQFDLSIPEGLPGTVLVSTVEATDGDDFGPNVLVTYSLVGSSPIFSVQENGSIFANAELLDADVSDPSYIITILATDGGTPSLQTAANFTITVTDVNDNSPQFPASTYSADIRENAAPGTSVAVVSATDADSGENGRISYSLRPILDTPLLLPFTIDNSTGLVTNTRTFDWERESLLSYNLAVRAVDNGNPPRSSLVPISINIVDENDNAPMFNTSTYTVSILENSPNRTSVLTVSATDADSGTNAQFTYHIVTNSDMLPFSSEPLFIVNPATGNILVNGIVDAEIQSEISFVVEARDMGSPSSTGSATVVLSVTDVNDNQPQFNMSVYAVSVEESVPVGTIVTTIAALDADSNENGRVLYNLIDNTNSFTINSATGEISTIASLDFEADCFYRLLAVAFDNGPSLRLNATAMVEVTLSPVHDVPPVFSMPSYNSTVMENMPPGSSIVQVSAVDGDITECEETTVSSGSSPLDITVTPATPTNFQYSLLNHMDNFSIDAETGLITTLTQLDYESSPQLTLRVRASDLGGLFSEVPVIVTLLDLNDNPPMFGQPFYAVPLTESSPVGTTVLQPTASDRDLIDQGRLQFSLSGVPPGVFIRIGSQTGAITTTGVIDFDTLGSMAQFFGLVTDTAQQVGSTIVRLNITDVIDIPPVINTPPRVLSFTEGTFSLLPFPEINITDADTSQILCSASVTLVTSVSNSAGECSCQSSQISSCTLGCLEFLQVPLSAFPGSVVQSSNGTSLMLVGNFSIQVYTTAIQSIQYVNLISNPVPEARTIEVYVFDCQLPSNIRVNTIDVQALNVFPPVVDLNGPAAAGLDYTATFVERGYSVFITARDAVISDNDTIREREELTGLDISITNPQPGDFLIFPVSLVPAGVSYTNTSSLLSFTGAAAIPDYTSLDYSPVILTQPPLANRETSFYEEAAGIPVASPNAVISDLDSSTDPITGLQVSLTASSPPDLLYLNSSSSLPAPISMASASNNSYLEFTGNASAAHYDQVVRSVLYRFIGEEFDYIFPMRFIQFQVADTIRSSFSIVLVNFIPINDQVPEFDLEQYSAEVLENATIGYNILRLTSTDGDKFSANRIRYEIIAGNDGGIFSVSQSTGDVVLERLLDHEVAMSHSFTVQVQDDNYEGAVAMTLSTATVTIIVADVNDGVPMLDSEEYNATVGESVPIGHFVLQVTASDEDSAIHSALEFSLVGTTDFVITQDGRILTNVELDRERVEEYQFVVRVRNPGVAAFDVALVNISVQDFDDHPPAVALRPNTAVLIEQRTMVPLAVNLEILDPDRNPSLDYAIVQILGRPSIGQLLSTVQSETLEVSGNNTSVLIITGNSRQLDDYVSVLRGVVYQDLAEEPKDVQRTIAYQVGSNQNGSDVPMQLQEGFQKVTSNISFFVVTVQLVNDHRPSLSLDGRQMTNLPSPCQGAPGSYFTTYAENQLNPVSLSHSSLAITDNDSGDNRIEFAEVQILNAADRGLERIAVSLPANSSIAVSTESDDFKIILTGPAALQEYEAALRSIV